MGRGNRNAPVLALKPLPSRPSWLDSLIKFEQETFHEAGETACEVPSPNSDAPRFVAIESTDLEGSRVHTFRYYETPEDLLAATVPAVRVLKNCFTYVVEYLPHASSFSAVNLTGYLRPYTNLIRLAKSAASPEERVKYARTISAACGLPILSNYQGEEQFLFSTRPLSGTLYLNLADSIGKVESAIAPIALSPVAFVFFYDLNVGDHQVPVRFGMRFTDFAGTVHGWLEPH